MAASLTWSVSVTNSSDTTVTVKVTLKCKSTYGSYNADAVSGYITIGGTKYSFSHSFSANTTTTLATKSKSITRTTAAQSISIKASYSTGVSSGTITKSGSATVSARPKYTVTFNGNGGTSSSATVYYGYTTTFPTSTRTGYTLANWGSSSYTAGATTPAITAAKTFTASWTANKYTVSFNANGGIAGETTQLTRTYNTAMSINEGVTPSRFGFNFLGWADSTTATEAQYTSSYPASTSTADMTLYAVWEESFVAPAFNLSGTKASRCDSSGNLTQDGTYAKIAVSWTNGKNADASTAQVTSVKYEYKLEDSESWTAITTQEITSGTTASLTTASLFTTSLTYNIRITLTDDNTAISYTTFISKSSYIWRVPSGGQSLELGVDLVVNDNKDITLTIDDSAGSGTDYDIKTALTALGWDVTAE